MGLSQEASAFHMSIYFLLAAAQCLWSSKPYQFLHISQLSRPLPFQGLQVVWLPYSGRGLSTRQTPVSKSWLLEGPAGPSQTEAMRSGHHSRDPFACVWLCAWGKWWWKDPKASYCVGWVSKADYWGNASHICVCVCKRVCVPAVGVGLGAS